MASQVAKKCRTPSLDFGASAFSSKHAHYVRPDGQPIIQICIVWRATFWRRRGKPMQTPNTTTWAKSVLHKLSFTKTFWFIYTIKGSHRRAGELNIGILEWMRFCAKFFESIRLSFSVDEMNKILVNSLRHCALCMVNGISGCHLANVQIDLMND